MSRAGDDVRRPVCVIGARSLVAWSADDAVDLVFQL